MNIISTISFSEHRKQIIKINKLLSQKSFNKFHVSVIYEVTDEYVFLTQCINNEFNFRLCAPVDESKGYFPLSQLFDLMDKYISIYSNLL